MKATAVSKDISSNLAGCVFGNLFYIPTKFGSNQFLIQYSCFSNISTLSI